MRFGLISDVHIRNLKFHKQLSAVLEKVYSCLREEKVDCVLFLGDLFHVKNSISAEAYDIAANFLSTLASIAPTHLILGNHDCYMRNQDRLDSISPVVNALALDNIHFHKNTSQCDLSGDIRLNILSILDKENWDELSIDKDKINIALYHGPVVGSITDKGWTVDKGDMNIELLKKFDYAFCGDIHAHQLLDKNGKILYVGSLLQGDYGEADDKGFLIYEINSSSDFSIKRNIIPNPKPFISLEIGDDFSIDDLNIPEGSNVRLISHDNLTYDTVNKYMDIIRSKYSPDSVVYNNKYISKGFSLTGEEGVDLQENIRDISTQEKLIREYLKDYKTSEETTNEVLKLNAKYNSVALQNEKEISRNVYWKLKMAEWDNLFNYGEGNKIDYSKLSGIVGLFAKSFSGKSGAQEVAPFTIFNSITKNSKKNYNIINQNKKKGRGKVEVEVGNDTYVIERTCEKYDKFVKGKKTEEAKTTVDFYRINKETGEKENLNGAERNDTEKNIRGIFGTIEDFLLTSMASQFGSMEYINEGSTRRKEILAKFLDLDIFDRKFKLAKEDAQELKSAIKRSGDLSSYEERISTIKKDLNNSNATMIAKREKCSAYKEEKKIKEVLLQTISKNLEKNGDKKIDVVKLESELKQLKERYEGAEKEIALLEEKIKNRKETIEKIENFKKNLLNIEELKSKKEEVDRKKVELERLDREIEKKNSEMKTCEKKALLLKEVPCGKEYSNCKFIYDAYQAVEIKKNLEKEVGEIVNVVNEIRQDIEKSNSGEIEKHIENYNSLREKHNKYLIEIPNLETGLIKSQNLLGKNKDRATVIEAELGEYYLNREFYDNLDGMRAEKAKLERKIKDLNGSIESCDREILDVYRKHGSIEQQLMSERENRNNLVKMRKEYEAYDLLLGTCHSDGIPFEIIKKKLPYINTEISKVLSSVVSFTVFFENDDDKLNLFIKHQNFDPRPLDMGSGAEKVLASLAIRLALTKITTLPRSSILILDEPAINFDSNILDSFSALLQSLKEEYETIILISHLEQLKDLADSEISLTTKDKYAYINCV